MKRSIESVFTPRKADVNDSMYVERPQLEKDLRRALAGSQHVVLFGESGNGKSWLYKKVLSSEGYYSVNCADAARSGSIALEIVRRAFPEGLRTRTEITEEKSAGLAIPVANAGLRSQNKYELTSSDELKPALRELSRLASPNAPVVVIENLESIFLRKELMEELGNILLLLDDDSLSDAPVRFLIVGTPADVLEYFSRAENLSSVANRLVELAKVEGFSVAEVYSLVDKGFRNELKVSMTDAEVHALSKRVHAVTMGVAQRVHEYCLNLAYELEDAGWVYEPLLMDGAENRWLVVGLRQCYTVVEGCLNSRETAVERRNQVVWAIGKMSGHDFSAADIERRIRHEFPETVNVTNMGVGAILAKLASGSEPLLSRNERTGAYRAKDPRYLMCIRVALAKDSTTKRIIRRKFKHG